MKWLICAGIPIIYTKSMFFFCIHQKIPIFLISSIKTLHIGIVSVWNCDSFCMREKKNFIKNNNKNGEKKNYKNVISEEKLGTKKMIGILCKQSGLDTQAWHSIARSVNICFKGGRIESLSRQMIAFKIIFLSHYFPIKTK